MAFVGRSQIFGRLPARRGRTSRFLWSAARLLCLHRDRRRAFGRCWRTRSELAGRGRGGGPGGARGLRTCRGSSATSGCGGARRRVALLARVQPDSRRPARICVAASGGSVASHISEVRRLSSIHNIKLSYMTDIMLDRCNQTEMSPPLVPVITQGRSPEVKLRPRTLPRVWPLGVTCGGCLGNRESAAFCGPRVSYTADFDAFPCMSCFHLLCITQ